MQHKKRRAIQAVQILNALLGDLIIGRQARRILSAQMSGKPRVLTLINRLCLSHLFLACCKYLEFYKTFSDVVPADCIGAARELRRRIAHLKVVEFRNKHVGHILDRGRHRPMTLQEVQDAVDNITGGDADAFVDWCAGPERRFPDSFATVVERLRTRIEEEFSLSDDDVFSPHAGAV